MLAAQDATDAAETSDETPRAPRWRPAAVAIGVPVAAVLVYLAVGAPELGDRPNSATSPRSVQNGGAGDDMERAVGRLAERLQSAPDDLEGWTLLGGSLVALKRFAQAAVAYDNAVSLAPDDAGLLAKHGEAMTFANGGTVTPRARELFEAALAADPRGTRARFYLGVADAQAGKRRAALDRWIALEADSPPDAPWLRALRPRIEALARDLELDLAELRSETPRFSAPGPTSEDVAAAQSMSAGDREAMIRSMVERLAGKLRDQPDDADGWVRLGRSYGVLGDAGKSRDAYARGAKLRPKDTAILAAYAAALMTSVGPEAPPPAEFAAVIDTVLRLEPENPKALWLGGIGAKRTGDRKQAERHWLKLLALLRPGTPEHTELKQRIEALERANR